MIVVANGRLLVTILRKPLEKKTENEKPYLESSLLIIYFPAQISFEA